MTATMGAIPPILLVGCGRMGGAMLSGWREQGLAASVAVDPAPSAAAFAGPDMTVVADASAIPAGFVPAAVVLAVKPQNAAATLPAYARFAPSTVFLSIMAGRTIAGLSTLLRPADAATLIRAPAAIVRAMPNTPAAVARALPSRAPARPSRCSKRRCATGCCWPSARSPGSRTKRCSIRSPPSPAVARPTSSCSPN